MRRGLPELGEIIASKYLVTGQLGRGGMGAVYVVQHRLTGKRLAVKCLLPEHLEYPELVERFLREAQAAGRIQHRYVVDVFDVGRDGELLYIVMELLEGKQLADLLREATWSLEDLLAVLLRAMEGVAAAHKQGIVHRDLKPENIIVCAGHSGKLDDPRVLDFGISKLDEDAAKPLTRSGVMMGTPYYMSFEQISSQRDLDQRVDVYAMGVILYEALSGRVPYVAESVGALAVRMLTTPPEPLANLRPDLPPELIEVIMRSIARDRDERYPTMRALIEALVPFTSGETTGVMERPSKQPARSGSVINSMRIAEGEEPTLLVTPARAEKITPVQSMRSSVPNARRELAGAAGGGVPHSEPRSSIPSQGDVRGEGQLRVSAHDNEPRPQATPELPLGKLLLAGAALLLGIVLTALLWPDSEPEAPASSAPAAGPSQGPRVVVPPPSPALAPPPAAPAPVPTPAEETGSAAGRDPAPLDSVLDTAAVDAPEAAGDAKGSRGRRRRARDERTLEQMVPHAPAPRPEEQDPPPAEKPAAAAPEPSPEPAPPSEPKSDNPYAEPAPSP
jgi:serine/threonine protein kinase